MLENAKVLDALIIGGGPAGVSAALHLGFHRRQVAIIDRRSSPMHFHSNPVNNYPGVKPLTTGREILKKMREELDKYQVPVITGNVVNIKGKCPEFLVEIEVRPQDTRNRVIQAKTLLFATGIARKHPQVKGDWRLWLPYAAKNEISYYCPDCESPLVVDKDILIVNAGTANSAIHVAKAIAPMAKHVRIFMTEDSYRPFTRDDTKILERSGFAWTRGLIEEIEIEQPGKKQYLITDKGEKLECNHFFVSFVAVPRSELAQKLGVEVDQRGNIITDHRGKTRVEGVWAAGDVRPITQSVAMAVGTGNYAAVMMNQFLLDPSIPEDTRDHPELRAVPK